MFKLVNLRHCTILWSIFPRLKPGQPRHRATSRLIPAKLSDHPIFRNVRNGIPMQMLFSVFLIFLQNEFPKAIGHFLLNIRLHTVDFSLNLFIIELWICKHGQFHQRSYGCIICFFNICLNLEFFRHSHPPDFVKIHFFPFLKCHHSLGVLGLFVDFGQNYFVSLYFVFGVI